MATKHSAPALLVWGLLACACGHNHEHDHDHNQGGNHVDQPSSSLPSANAQGAACDGLTYKNTAKPLADKYCVRCHTTRGVVRPNEFAPTGLDDEASWIEHGGHALELLHAGAMPLVPPVPTMVEVERLTRWLGCEDALRPHSHDQGSH